jgi:hypothetical protein
VLKRRVILTLAPCAIAAVTVLAVACGSSADTSTAPPATAEPTTVDSESASAPTATVGPNADAPRPGGRGVPPAGLGRGSRFVPLDNPEFVSADEATFLTPDDRVLGLEVGGESRAYPINMMTFHHVANDELGGLPVLVTF